MAGLLLTAEVGLLRQLQSSGQPSPARLGGALWPLLLLAALHLAAAVLCRAASPAKTMLAVTVAAQVLAVAAAGSGSSSSSSGRGGDSHRPWTSLLLLLLLRLSPTIAGAWLISTAMLWLLCASARASDCRGSAPARSNGHARGGQEDGLPQPDEAAAGLSAGQRRIAAMHCLGFALFGAAAAGLASAAGGGGSAAGSLSLLPPALAGAGLALVFTAATSAWIAVG